jgi:membrane-bound lytic murein transglycosylase B
LVLLILSPGWAAAADWTPLIERLTADGFERRAVEAHFARSETLFEPDAMARKIAELIRNRTAETARDAVRSDYLTHRTIARARAYIEENRVLLEDIQGRYGVPKEIVVSILLIETRLGEKTGIRIVFNRLASMALSADLDFVSPHLKVPLLGPESEAFARRRCREKADWAYDELKALLRLADQNGLDPMAIRGSIYGAIGLCQFMPSNVFIFGVDADRDGRIDLFAKPDALHSIANYLRGHGWQPGLDREGRQRVIFAYNHSTVYANTVLAIAERLRDRKERNP